MRRMKRSGYNEGYRRNALNHALRISDKMKKEETGKPVYRPRDWQQEQRMIDKKKKKYSWSSKGGYIAPIMVPATPNGELANILRGVAEGEASDGIKFKIQEVGGRSIKSIVQKSNPTATPGCDKPDCMPCMQGRGNGGNCMKSNVQYEVKCTRCPVDRQPVYIGETSRNLYTRAKEHQDRYRKRNKDSFMLDHQLDQHQGEEAQYVTKNVKNFQDCLTRQISEGIYIRRSDKPVLNSKSEWHQPCLWKVQTEIQRG